MSIKRVFVFAILPFLILVDASLESKGTTSLITGAMHTGTAYVAKTVSDGLDQREFADSNTDSSPVRAFFMAISMISLSEIGDKTFLIAALMAMRHPRFLVFSAAAVSLTIMTVLSGLVGHAAVSFIPETGTTLLAGFLFLVFGYKLTIEGLEMSKDAGVEDELAEVEEELAVKDINYNLHNVENGGAINEKINEKQITETSVEKIERIASLYISPVWIQVFIMIFLGELGDRSQISIIAMASDSDYWFTIFGAVVGHCICSAIAVIGGRFLASKISMRTVTLSGAVCFFIFGLIYMYGAYSSYVRVEL